MAESKFNLGKYKSPLSAKPGSTLRSPATPARPAAGSKASEIRISCRATNPLSLQDDVGKVFLDEQQAKATTATRLFRNDEIFNAICKVVLPSFFESKRGKFAMWSTGCSSGEEVYSMAMIAMNEFQKAKRTAIMEAFGTDINQNCIAKARAGRYGKPSDSAFSANYWRLLQTYAKIGNHNVQMGPQLMTNCKFALFDMRNRPKKYTFYFIVCNHVLQYYDAEGQRHILSNLKAVLNPGGFLYLEGITESGLQGSNLVRVSDIPNMYAVG